MTLTWSNEPSGLVKTSADGTTYAAITVRGTPSYGDYARIVRKYGPWVEKHRGPLPAAWVVGILFAENSGDHSVSLKGAIGPMQITRGASGKGIRYLMNPEQNIAEGCRILTMLASLPGADLPSVASMYNAGRTEGGRPHPSDASPWGFVEERGYIERAVAGANEFVLRPVPEEAPKKTGLVRVVAPPTGEGAGLGIAVAVVGAGVLWILAKQARMMSRL